MIKKDTIWKAVGVFEVEIDASEKDEWGAWNGKASETQYTRT